MENNGKGIPKVNSGTLSWQGGLPHPAWQWRNVVTPEYRRDHCNYSFYAATQLIVTPSFHMLINLKKSSFELLFSMLEAQSHFQWSFLCDRLQGSIVWLPAQEKFKRASYIFKSKRANANNSSLLHPMLPRWIFPCEVEANNSRAAHLWNLCTVSVLLCLKLAIN